MGKADEQLGDDFRPLRMDAAIANGSLDCTQSIFGIGTHTDSEYVAAEATIVRQYVLTGMNEIAAKKVIAGLDLCFRIYEVPLENKNQSNDGNPRQPAIRH